MDFITGLYVKGREWSRGQTMTEYALILPPSRWSYSSATRPWARAFRPCSTRSIVSFRESAERPIPDPWHHATFDPAAAVDELEEVPGVLVTTGGAPRASSQSEKACTKGGGFAARSGAIVWRVRVIATSQLIAASTAEPRFAVASRNPRDDPVQGRVVSACCESWLKLTNDFSM